MKPDYANMFKYFLDTCAMNSLSLNRNFLSCSLRLKIK